MTQPIPAIVEHPSGLIGSYIRNTRDDLIYKVVAVGGQGATVYQAEGFGGNTGGPEILLTWRLFKAIYSIMVHAADIDTKELH